MRIGNLVAVHWRDKRDVYACSTIQGTGVEIVKRKHVDPITKSKITIDYNNHMNGVDKCDQFLVSYPLCRKTVKWWKQVFVRMFELAVINSVVIYFRNNPEFAGKYQSHKLYRAELIHQLVQPLLNCKV